ncbi:MAG: DUF2461 domain-containing protein [Bacteroidetes bacterium]|nr:DUF2461 domain-containing protein [Bacteroidota bacterium]
MKTLHPETFEFLNQLKANNSKDWMDANRKWYQSMRDGLVDYANTLQQSFAEVYPMHVMDPKKYLSRINNNRRFHPDKPPYKTHFALMVKRRGPGLSDYYLHIEPDNVFIGVGLYHPPRELLNALRDLIAVRGQDLQAIEQEPSFKKVYGSFQGEKLKKAPKGFDIDHPYIELLRHKDLVIMKNLKPESLFTEKGLKEIKEAFQAALPFMDFIDEAIASV